jgi:cleavage and polyadenylation specificity factor subunit 5
MYPFIPAHVTRPKECKKLYFIQLPRSSMSSEPFDGSKSLIK